MTSSAEPLTPQEQLATDLIEAALSALPVESQHRVMFRLKDIVINRAVAAFAGSDENVVTSVPGDEDEEFLD